MQQTQFQTYDPPHFPHYIGFMGFMFFLTLKLTILSGMQCVQLKKREICLSGYNYNKIITKFGPFILRTSTFSTSNIYSSLRTHLPTPNKKYTASPRTEKPNI
jgi:hypothetical protein